MNGASEIKVEDSDRFWIAPKLDVKRLVDSLNPQKLFHYEGSLTVPQCAEIVQWIVVDDPQPISEE